MSTRPLSAPTQLEDVVAMVEVCADWFEERGYAGAALGLRSMVSPTFLQGGGTVTINTPAPLPEVPYSERESGHHGAPHPDDKTPWIAKLVIPKQLQTVLKWADVRTLGQLRNWSAIELIMLQGCGRLSVQAARKVLRLHGLNLRGESGLDCDAQGPLP